MTGGGLLQSRRARVMIKTLQSDQERPHCYLCRWVAERARVVAAPQFTPQPQTASPRLPGRQRDPGAKPTPPWQRNSGSSQAQRAVESSKDFSCRTTSSLLSRAATTEHKPKHDEIRNDQLRFVKR